MPLLIFNLCAYIIYVAYMYMFLFIYLLKINLNQVKWTIKTTEILNFLSNTGTTMYNKFKCILYLSLIRKIQIQLFRILNTDTKYLSANVSRD